MSPPSRGLYNDSHDTPDNSNSNRFWLEFRVVSDGLELATVSAMRAAAVAGGGPKRFSLFPNLPAEIRLKIWEHLIVPRVVAVACLDAETASSQREDLLLSRPARPPIPVLLHISHETRALALAHYELAFSWKVPLVLAGMDLPVSHYSPHLHPHPYPYPPSPPPPPPAWSRPRVWFNFALDTVYLLGELEPCDSFGINSPMAYFLDRREARRVRRAAVAFGALRYGEAGVQQIFGSLFHVVDRFPPSDGRVIVTVTAADEYTHTLMGGDGPLVPLEEGDVEPGVREIWGGDGSGNEGGAVDWDGVEVMEGRSSSVSYQNGAAAVSTSSSQGLEAGGQRRQQQQQRSGPRQEEGNDNVLQKIWDYWYKGSIVKSTLANIEFVLVRESDLEKHILNTVTSALPESSSSSSKDSVVTEIPETARLEIAESNDW
ncbi:hypothetical protein F4810DRAFT_715173 [Camillea tinctor]|nr:hypothetical protein F4810DRAFT_715173 [Camillea tinctor]